MNQILIPLNLNADLDNILNYAESVALRSGAELTLLYSTTRGAIGGRVHTFHVHDSIAPFMEGIRRKSVRQHVSEICSRLLKSSVNFNLKMVSRSGSKAILQEANRNEYDLVLLGTHRQHGMRGLLRGPLASRVIGSIKAPVFVIPPRTDFNEIQHITYAVDLSDYDPSIIQQVKAIAQIFDAKLTVAHVNTEADDEISRERYLYSLEKTISDTLDYPKINYRFFDHVDIFAGLKKLINLNDSQMVAMTNRKKGSWKNTFRDASLTRKMARELTVPILAFRKN